MKHVLITAMILLVFLAMLAIIPIDIFGILILVIFAIVFIVIIIKQDIAWKKEEKQREEFYKKLCK